VRSKLTHNDTINCLTLSSDGKFVLTGSQDKSLKLWEVSTGYLTQVDCCVLCWCRVDVLVCRAGAGRPRERRAVLRPQRRSPGGRVGLGGRLGDRLGRGDGLGLPGLRGRGRLARECRGALLRRAALSGRCAAACFVLPGGRLTPTSRPQERLAARRGRGDGPAGRQLQRARAGAAGAERARGEPAGAAPAQCAAPGRRLPPQLPLRRRPDARRRRRPARRSPAASAPLQGHQHDQHRQRRSTFLLQTLIRELQ